MISLGVNQSHEKTKMLDAIIGSFARLFVSIGRLWRREWRRS